MTWIAAIALALGAFAIAALLFRLQRTLWTSFAAALTFGLAGYGLQASPDIPAAPKAAIAGTGEQQFDIVAARREFVSEDERSTANFLITSDAMARRGRYGDASAILTGLLRENPRDFEAWLAQGIAIAEHADGTLTPASLYAFQQAAALRPGHPAPGYFLGVALIRQGRMMEARSVWADALESAPEDAFGRAGIEERLLRLDMMLGAMQGAPQPGTAEPPAE